MTLLPARVHRWARSSTDAIAVISSGERLTFRELDRRANRLARLLSRRGLEGGVIALAFERGSELVVAMLAAWKVGAAYLPLDLSNPAERLQFVINDAAASVVVSCHSSRWSPIASSPDTLWIDGEREALENEADTEFQRPLSGDSLAYVIYTSGSTGRPKGCLVTHDNVARLFDAARERFAFEERDVWTCFHSQAFDFSVWEIWGALSHGARVVMVPHDVSRSPDRFWRLVLDERVTMLSQTPSAFRQLIQAVEDIGPSSPTPPHLRYVVLGGEALEPRSLAPWFSRFGDETPEIINGYGPTETTVFATFHQVRQSEMRRGKASNIGAPLRDLEILILGQDGAPVAAGEVGEIVIGGRGVSRGYLNRAEMTAEKFVPAPAEARSDSRFYRSGDLGRWTEDGEIEYLGRADRQVKIRGFRIELGEIESRIRALEGVRDTAVVVRGETGSESRLVAYIVAGRSDVSASRIRAELSQALPDYMCPSAIVTIDRLPLTTNGKLDEAALPEPGREREGLGTAFEPPADESERIIARSFSQLLGVEPVGRHDSFFDLGGSSMEAVELAQQLRATLGHPFVGADVFLHRTVYALARHARGSVMNVDSARPRAVSDLSAPIAIVAASGRFPGATDMDGFWANLAESRESITFFAPDELDASVPRAQASDPAYVRARGIIDGVEKFDPAFFGMTPREAQLTDPQIRLGVELSWELLEKAGMVGERSDASTPRQRVGVFAGMWHASYLRRHLELQPGLVERAGEFNLSLLNDKEYIATRIAHKLGLRGPAVSINTACSTSLVAVVQAVNSLRLGQCDTAIAGGVAVTCPPRSGYLYQEGNMLSSDGHTRSFDADGSGTVFSDGAAFVLLKRLEDAQASGDHVMAVIRGVAVNNDGADKASFTAPSADGQAEVIAEALRDAGVTADQVSYVEAHGTATPMGDPIEVEALTRAFRATSDRTGYCVLGSVKSNLGHLVMAAGATGLIKAALSLERELLPATVGFQRPNPQIDFSRTPFLVCGEPRAWPRGAVPRIAGVSSFGVGGTNAHVILQEAPAPETSSAPGESASGPWVFPLSARSASALSEAARRLASAFEQEPAPSLRDAAFTLARGRRAFRYRTAIVAANREAVTEALRGSLKIHETVGTSPVVMMFPGQGAQYPGMSRSWHRADEAFRDDLERCFTIAAEAGLPELREAMFSDDPERLRPTRLTQPALFVMELALAKALGARGITATAFIGHSVGEFVAAAMAGVMSEEDALRLVIQRGQLMQAQPEGAMLSVRLSADSLTSRLPAGLVVAVDNGPDASVVAGTRDGIAGLAASLAAEGIAVRELRTSHAFHSPMMSGAAEEFRSAVAQVKLAPPQIRIASTVSGQWLTEVEAMSTDYWARQLRDPVRFGPALRTVMSEEGSVLVEVEVGPRTTLTSLAKVQAMALGKPPLRHTIISTTGDAVDTERSAWLFCLASLWASGARIDLMRACGHDGGRIIPLPTYPFEYQHCWIDAPPATFAATDPATFSPESSRVASSTSLPDPETSGAPAQSSTGIESSAAVPGVRHEVRIAGSLAGIIEQVSGLEIPEGDQDSTFLDLGLDSLALTQVALQVQKDLGVKLTFRQLMRTYPTLRELSTFIASQVEPEPEPEAVIQAAALVAPMPVSYTGVATGSGSMGGDQALNVILDRLIRIEVALALRPAESAKPDTIPVASKPAPKRPSTAAPPEDDVALAHTRYDVKKAFGAIARIHTDKSELSPRQKARLDAFIRRYVEKTKGSKAFTERNRPRLADPRVVNGFRPATKEIIYQLVVPRSSGSRIWDIDGNEYVDALNGFGMNLFGWQPKFVADAIHKQVDAGYEIGPQHPLSASVSDLVCELTGFDRAALCNTGSEAVLGTLRIARTVTGRSLIVVFAGSYHGIFDEVLVRGTRTLRTVPAAPGVLGNSLQNVLVLDYGTPESLEIIRSRTHEIAAVLAEPVQSRRPDFRPLEFLRSVREITRQSGTVFILDEVITGFRAHQGGIRALYELDSDLAAYGKVMGGGLPIGVIAGKREFMDALDGGEWHYGDDSAPSVGVTYFAGTFVRHPLALAAAQASLEHMKVAGPELQRALTETTDNMAAELNSFCREVGAPIEIRTFSSLWRITFLEDHPYQDLLAAMMRSRGVHILEGFPCFLTTAHTVADVRLIVEAFRESVRELQESEFLPRLATTQAVQRRDARKPPVEGAKLGRGRDGKPAWFVADPDAPGKFRQVS